MKSTMSNRNIAKFHKLLAQDIPLKKISKFIGVTEAALKKFMPDRMAEVTVSKKAAAEKAAGKEAPVEAAKAPDKAEPAEAAAPAKAATAKKG